MIAAEDRVERGAWITLALLSAMCFVSTLDISVVIVAFDDIRRSFRSVSAAELSWVITAYTILGAALLVPAGRLADRMGADRTFVLGIAWFTVGSLLAGLAPGVWFLIGARLVQAFGSALMLPSAIALIATVFPPGRRNAAIGLWGAMGGLGSAVGPSLGSFIVESASWRWTFLVNVPLGAVVLVATLRHRVRVQRRPSLPSDVPGACAIIIGVGAIALALVQTESWGWVGGRTITAWATGAVFIAALLVRSRWAAAPIVDLALFRIPTFRWANAAAIAFPLAYFAQFFGAVRFLQHVWGYSTLDAGLLLTPTTIAQAGLTIGVGRAADRYGHRRVMVPGALVYCVGAIVWLALLDAGRNLVAFYIGASLLGFGIACTYAVLSVAAVHDLPPDRFGAGSAVNQMIDRVGGTLGIALAVALLRGEATAAAFDRVWCLMLAGGATTAVCSAFIDTRPSRQVVESLGVV